MKQVLPEGDAHLLPNLIKGSWIFESRKAYELLNSKGHFLWFSTALTPCSFHLSKQNTSKPCLQGAYPSFDHPYPHLTGGEIEIVKDNWSYLVLGNRSQR